MKIHGVIPHEATKQIPNFWRIGNVLSHNSERSSSRARPLVARKQKKGGRS